MNLRLWVVQGAPGEGTKNASVPFHHGWEDLCYHHLRLGAISHTIQSGAQGEAHPQSTHQHPWCRTVVEGEERQPREILFRTMGSTEHEIVVVDLNGEGVSPLVENQLPALGGDDTVEDSGGVHGLEDSTLDPVTSGAHLKDSLLRTG
jgi:hypothetical protein